MKLARSDIIHLAQLVWLVVFIVYGFLAIAGWVFIQKRAEDAGGSTWLGLLLWVLLLWTIPMTLLGLADVQSFVEQGEGP